MTKEDFKAERERELAKDKGARKVMLWLTVLLIGAGVAWGGHKMVFTPSKADYATTYTQSQAQPYHHWRHHHRHHHHWHRQWTQEDDGTDWRDMHAQIPGMQSADENAPQAVPAQQEAPQPAPSATVSVPQPQSVVTTPTVTPSASASATSSSGSLWLQPCTTVGATTVSGGKTWTCTHSKKYNDTVWYD